MNTTTNRWSSNWVFVLAATGAAVGLGNIWKFPYITGENGGGAFVLLYLVCIVIVGLPLMMAEILLGRRGRQNPVATMKTLALEHKRSRCWCIIGVLGLLSSFLILSYYSVIAGWTLSYTVHAINGDFTNATPLAIIDLFQHFIASPWQLLAWHSLIMIVTIWVVSCGVQKGIERAVLGMFPIMVLLLLLLVGYAIKTGYFTAGLHFLLYPDFSMLGTQGALQALGHAFFTLSLATGSIMMYGAYLPSNASITKASIAIVTADTGVALLAGLAIFPIVFANHLTASAGPGLIFKTLPIAFGHMHYGRLWGTLFFIMLVLAAFTSTLALLEPCVAWFIERFHASRTRAAWIIGSGIWLLGIANALSFNRWEHIRWLGQTLFQLADHLTANLMLPLGGLLIALFVGWRLPTEVSLLELQLPYHNRLCRIWRLSMRYIAPIAIVFIFVKALEVL